MTVPKEGRPCHKGDGHGCRFPAETASSGSAAEAATIAAVVDTFVRAIETSHFDLRFRIVELCDDAESDDESISKRDFAADSLQMQQRGIKDTILDCES